MCDLCDRNVFIRRANCRRLLLRTLRYSHQLVLSKKSLKHFHFHIENDHLPVNFLVFPVLHHLRNYHCDGNHANNNKQILRLCKVMGFTKKKNEYINFTYPSKYSDIFFSMQILCNT